MGERVLLIGKVLLLLLLSALPAATQQEEPFTLQVDVPLVVVDVSVTDESGRPVPGLDADDFEIRENGRPQAVRYFGSSAAPYQTFLLFDVSGSTQHKRDFMKRAAASFLAAMKPEDRVSIGVFDARLTMLLDGAAPAGRALPILDGLSARGSAEGTTEFYDSLERALRRNAEGVPVRQAIIVWTDGRDISLYRDAVRGRIPEIERDRRFNALLRAAASRRIPLYIVAVNTDRNLEENVQGGDEYRNLRRLHEGSRLPEAYLDAVRVRLERLAEVSGGRILFPEDLAEVEGLFREMSETLGRAYSLGYAPADHTNGEEFRRIVVKAGDYAIRQSRDGYYAR